MTSQIYHADAVPGVTNRVDDVPRDIHVEKSITVGLAPDEVYRFWRDFENLPPVFTGLESITSRGDNVYHWMVKGPTGTKYEWDAEIYNEIANELIAWRTINGADVANAGSIRFEKAPDNRGTYVRVTVNYNPTAGKLGQLLAKLTGKEPEQLIEQNLRRLKQFLETGEIATIEGQSSGREDEVKFERKQNLKAA
jgi:uncharacterized membrane protein